MHCNMVHHLLMSFVVNGTDYMSQYNYNMCFFELNVLGCSFKLCYQNFAI